MDKAARKSETVQLGHGNSRQVVITPETMDRFVFPEAKAVAACVTQAQYESFQRAMREKFQQLCVRIAEWCSARPEVAEALFSPRDGARYLLLLIARGEQHDFELADLVSDFDMELHRDFPEFPMSVMTVPEAAPGAVSAFVDAEEALRIYADADRAQGDRETLS